MYLPFPGGQGGGNTMGHGYRSIYQISTPLSSVFQGSDVCRAWGKIESTSEGGAKCNPITREKL